MTGFKIKVCQKVDSSNLSPSLEGDFTLVGLGMTCKCTCVNNCFLSDQGKKIRKEKEKERKLETGKKTEL